jgi:hypothetical protein
MAAETISRRLPDGAVEVWLDGWHIRFPVDTRPTVEQAAPPTPLPDPTAEVEATTFGSGRAVRVGSWIVAVTRSDFKVIPTIPEDNDVSRRHRYFRR